MVVHHFDDTAVETKFIIGNWESPWANDPYLRIRVAIDAHDRRIVILHQFVEESWIPFSASDDAYVRGLIKDELADIIEDQRAHHLRPSDHVPAAWLYDEAHPGEVDISCPVKWPDVPDCNPGFSRRPDRWR